MENIKKRASTPPPPPGTGTVPKVSASNLLKDPKKHYDEYDDSLSEGEIRDSEEEGEIVDPKLTEIVSSELGKDYDSMVQAELEKVYDSSGEIIEEKTKRKHTKDETEEDQIPTTDAWDTYPEQDASSYTDYGNAGEDWHTEQESSETCETAAIEQQIDSNAFENKYDPDGPPIDYYIPWIDRQTKYDSRPYYRPIPILDDAYYMYDWDFGGPFYEYEYHESDRTSRSEDREPKKVTKETSLVKKTSEDSSDSDDEKHSLLQRKYTRITPPEPIETLSHRDGGENWLQCPFCGRMFLELMAFDNHIMYVHGKESNSQTKQIWKKRAFSAGHSWKCELCKNYEGNANLFFHHLKSLHHISNLAVWGDWEIKGYADGDLMQPIPKKDAKDLVRVSSDHHSYWYSSCVLCERYLLDRVYVGKLVPSGSMVSFTHWAEFARHLVSHHFELCNGVENTYTLFTSDMIKLILYLMLITNADEIPIVLAPAVSETLPKTPVSKSSRGKNKSCEICHQLGHNADRCIYKRRIRTMPDMIAQAMSIGGMTVMRQAGVPAPYAPQYATAPQYTTAAQYTPALMVPAAPAQLPVFAYAGLYVRQKASSSVPDGTAGSQVPVTSAQNLAPGVPFNMPGSGSQAASSQNQSATFNAGQSMIGQNAGRHAKTGDDGDAPHQSKRRKRQPSESSDDSYDSDEARMGSRVHHAARRRQDSRHSRESSYDSRSDRGSRDDHWGRSDYYRNPHRESSEYQDKLSDYRNARRGSSYCDERRRRRRREHSEESAKPFAFVDNRGQQVIDYQNMRCSTDFNPNIIAEQPEPEVIEQETQGISEPPGLKIPDFNDLASILQTVQKQTERKQEIRAQGMTDLLKTLYNKPAEPGSAAAKPAANLSVFDQMQNTIHKILRDGPAKKGEDVKGGSIRATIIKLAEKLYKDEFAEGTELCTSLVDRVVKDFVAVKSASSTSTSPAGPAGIDPRIRAAQEEKAQLTVLIRRHAEELRLIRQAKQLVNTVAESSSEEEEDAEDDAAETPEDPLAAKKKLLLISYGVILDSLAPGAIQSEQDNQIAADIILQLTHHMFNVMKSSERNASNTIGLQEKYMLIGQLKGRYGSEHALINALDYAVMISLDVINELCKLEIDLLNKLPVVLWQQPGLAVSAFQDFNFLQEIIRNHLTVH